MEGMFTFVGIIIIVFGILQIILFFKMWGMTNDVQAIKNKYLNSTENSNSKFETDKNAYTIIDNIEFDKEDFPKNTKFRQGDMVLYKTENTKLIVIGCISPNVFKCKTVDGSNKIYCFQADYLDRLN